MFIKSFSLKFKLQNIHARKFLYPSYTLFEKDKLVIINIRHHFIPFIQNKGIIFQAA